MKNNKITMEKAQERVNNLYGQKPFTIKNWDGSKKPVCISYGNYNAVKIMIDRGEYLYRKDMKNHVLGKIYNEVQLHLDQQGKNMTLISIAGENEPAIAVCHCCGSELYFRTGKKITPKYNECIQHQLYLENKEKQTMYDMAITGIYATESEEELTELMKQLERKREGLRLFIKQYERKVKSTKKELSANRAIIKKQGIHEYFNNKYDKAHRYDMFWEVNDELECA